MSLLPTSVALMCLVRCGDNHCHRPFETVQVHLPNGEVLSLKQLAADSESNQRVNHHCKQPAIQPTQPTSQPKRKKARLTEQVPANASTSACDGSHRKHTCRDSMPGVTKPAAKTLQVKEAVASVDKPTKTARETPQADLRVDVSQLRSDSCKSGYRHVYMNKGRYEAWATSPNGKQFLGTHSSAVEAATAVVMFTQNQLCGGTQPASNADIVLQSTPERVNTRTEARTQKPPATATTARMLDGAKDTTAGRPSPRTSSSKGQLSKCCSG